MILLPGDLYTVDTCDKMSDACKYPLILFSISKGKKYKNLSKIAQLSNCSKTRISTKYTQTALSNNDQTVNVRISNSVKVAFLSYMQSSSVTRLT